MSNNFPLVSIITPCFNGEKYLHRFFDSILNQTYNNIEMIFVNDGSTDNTELIATEYGEKLKNNGVHFVYCYQKNSGQAAAINRGLEFVRGEYLTWPDSDDWLDKCCIEVKVKYMKEHPEWGMICCRTAAVNEVNLQDGIYKYDFIMERKSKDNGRFFLDLIIEHDVYFAPGGYMVRTQCLFSELNHHKIYEGRGGQNWQLLLPVAHKYTCGFIDEILYYYLVRDDSHSHSVIEYNDLLNRTYEHQKTLWTTINNMNIDLIEKEYLFKIIKSKYVLKRYKLSLKSGTKQDRKKYYLEMKDFGLVDLNTKLEYHKNNNLITYYLYRFLYFPRGFFRRVKRRMSK